MNDDRLIYPERLTRWQPNAALPVPASASSFRAVWISDLHLGTRACKADALLNFLQCHMAESLYLVGDIVDGWNHGRAWYWSGAQDAVVREIANWRHRGARLVFLPGNHDEMNLDLVEFLFGPIRTHSELVHVTADSKRLLVTHGHQFDDSLSSVSWFSRMGGQAYTLVLRINEWSIRERLNADRGLAAFLKRPVTKAVDYIAATESNEQEIVRIVRRQRADGIVCGHTHRPEQRQIGAVLYLNDGDWVENCTALVEDHDGALRLLRWKPGHSPGIDRQTIASEQPSETMI